MSKCRYDLSEDCNNTDCLNCVLDKIRAEIEDLDRFYDNDYFSGNRDSMFKCNDVMQIFDKYRTESEEQAQIVIKLDKDIIESLDDGVGLSDYQYKSLIEAITNGTTFPKGCRKMVDADEIIEQANNMADELDNDFTIADIEKVGTLLERVSPILEYKKLHQTDHDEER